MKKITVSLLAVILIIGIIISIYLFVKNQQIQDGLKNATESEFVESGDPEALYFAVPKSEVTLKRKDGAWSVSETGDYSIETGSLDFSFTGYKVGGEHTGTFNDMNVATMLNDEGMPVEMDLTIYPSSVVTDSEGVDKHLQDTVFFNTAEYPEIKISVNRFETDGFSTISAITDITIKGITKTIRIPFEIVRENDNLNFSLDTKIKISEWDIAYGPVLDDVRVMLKGTILKK